MPIHITSAVLDQEVLRDIEIPPKSEFDNKILRRGSPTMITSMVVNCPRQADARYGINLPKIPYVETAATRQGVATHAAAEANFKFDIPIPTRIHNRLPGFSKRLAVYKQHPAFNPAGVEQGIYLNEDGPCRKWEHALSADSDLLIHDPSRNMIVYCDWKDQATHKASGAAKPAKLDVVQAELTAALAFMSDPNLKIFIAFYEFLQHQQTVRAVFTRSKPIYKVHMPDGTNYDMEYSIPSKVRELWWRQRNSKFPPKPSGLCNGWCSVKYEEPGLTQHTCEYWKPKK